MSCSKFEIEVALYAGNDLPAERMARVESHLADCADCRAFAAELRLEQEALNELRDEPLEDALVAQVRQRVLSQVVAGRSSRHRAWTPVVALAAAVVLAAVLLWPRHPAKQAPVARLAPPVVAPSESAPPLKIVPVRHRAVRRRHSAPVAHAGTPVLVQFVTDNPNIVIYWLVDQKPQGD